MSHGQSGKRIQHSGGHRGMSYDNGHHIAEEDSRVLRRAQDKEVVRDALSESETPETASSRGPSVR